MTVHTDQVSPLNSPVRKVPFLRPPSWKVVVCTSCIPYCSVRMLFLKFRWPFPLLNNVRSQDSQSPRCSPSTRHPLPSVITSGASLRASLALVPARVRGPGEAIFACLAWPGLWVFLKIIGEGTLNMWFFAPVFRLKVFLSFKPRWHEIYTKFSTERKGIAILKPTFFKFVAQTISDQNDSGTIGLHIPFTDHMAPTKDR